MGPHEADALPVVGVVLQAEVHDRGGLPAKAAARHGPPGLLLLLLQLLLRRSTGTAALPRLEVARFGAVAGGGLLWGRCWPGLPGVHGPLGAGPLSLQGRPGAVILCPPVLLAISSQSCGPPMQV